MTKRMLSRTEVIKAHGLFKEHLAPSDREGYFKYCNGWDDTRVAQEFEPLIQTNSVARLRVELFGQLDTSQNTGREENAKLKELEVLTSNLLACYGELEIKYNKLIDTLAIGRVADVKHLKTTVKEAPHVAK